MTKVVRGEKLIYEEAKEEDICRGCAWSPIGQSCLVWQYRKPEVCKSIRKILADEPTGHYISPNQEKTSVIEMLSYWDCDTKKKEFKYVRIKSILDCNGWRIVSTRKTNFAGYQRFLKKKAKEKAKARTLLQYIPINPW